MLRALARRPRLRPGRAAAASPSRSRRPARPLTRRRRRRRSATQLSELDEVLAAIEMATQTLERTYAGARSAEPEADATPPVSPARRPRGRRAPRPDASGVRDRAATRSPARPASVGAPPGVERDPVMGEEPAAPPSASGRGGLDLGRAADPRSRERRPGVAGRRRDEAGRHGGPAPDPPEPHDEPGRRAVDRVDEDAVDAADVAAADLLERGADALAGIGEIEPRATRPGSSAVPPASAIGAAPAAALEQLRGGGGGIGLPADDALEQSRRRTRPRRS